MRIDSSIKDYKAYRSSKTRNSLSTWFTTWWAEWLIMRANSTHRTQSCRISMITALLSHHQDLYSHDLSFGTMVSTTLLWPITSLILRCKFCTVGLKKSIYLAGLAENRSGDSKSALWCQIADLFTKMFLSLIHRPLFFLCWSFWKIKISFPSLRLRE